MPRIYAGPTPMSRLGIRGGRWGSAIRQRRLAERVNQSEVQRAAYLFVARNTQFPMAMRLNAQLAFNNGVLFPKYASPSHWAPRCILTNSRRRTNSFQQNLNRSEFRDAIYEGRIPGYEFAHW